MANIGTTTLPSQNDGCWSTPTYSRRERDDNYWGVIVVLNDRFRIIVCKDAIQFILQKRSVPSPEHRDMGWQELTRHHESGLIAALFGPRTALRAICKASVGGVALRRTRLRLSDGTCRVLDWIGLKATMLPV